jgi:hypothetical protein|eukprot:COSAG06_NODE_13513_length_1250_cov_0.987837_1_plen_101_part_00
MHSGLARKAEPADAFHQLTTSSNRRSGVFRSTRDSDTAVAGKIQFDGVYNRAVRALVDAWVVLHFTTTADRKQLVQERARLYSVVPVRFDQSSVALGEAV